MKTLEQEARKRLEKEIDEWVPRGKDNSRGAAGVFFGAAILEIRGIIGEFRNCPDCKLCAAHKEAVGENYKNITA